MGKFKIKRSPNKSKPDFVNPDGIAFVIGNGTSRKDFDLNQLTDHGILFGCNYFYRDMHPHVLVLSDEAITNTVAKVDKAWMMRNHVYSWYPKNGGKIKKVAFPEKTSAGLMAVYEAIETFKCKKIFLVGMDFFGLGSKGSEDNGKINNMYVGKKHYAQDPEQHAPTYRNWQRRFQWVLQEYTEVDFYHVAPLDGKSPERLIGAPNFHQVGWEDVLNHFEHDRELMDMKTINQADVDLFYAPNPDNTRAQLERQMVGQENFIYPDKIHPQDLVRIRLMMQQRYRQMGFDGSNYLQIPIKEFQITVPPTLIQTANGIALADDNYIIQSYEIEAKQRYNDWGIKLEPFKSLVPKSNAPMMAPPPPPPGMDFDIPPPPPPPSF